ncbi:MAG: hypothetical protein DRR08_13865 [Candidatus Parabeggiatoa sp. nov. 2]|nr:MAG: hypothetical protein B6247_05010 [Beggiatoa sp. 4572_84]RKZ59466.1 MAG: hypothetical protein DRR08_13865 [Gammaproteobacteria bacterium]
MLKIRQQTPTQLILRHRPIALWVMGSFFTIVGVVIIILFSKASSFTCERVPPNQGRCELIYSHFLMSKSIIISINDLKGTEVVTTRARQMDNFFILKPYYRVILITPTQRIPLTPYGTSSREEQEALAAKINAFLKKTPETSLLIKRDNRWFIYILGSILIVVGLLAELSKIITVTFDKMVGSLKIERQGLLGTEVIEHPLEEISEVKLNTSSYFNSKTILYQVVLELKTDENLLLTANGSMGRARKQQIVDEITNFLTH